MWDFVGSQEFVEQRGLVPGWMSPECVAAAACIKGFMWFPGQVESRRLRVWAKIAGSAAGVGTESILQAGAGSGVFFPVLPSYGNTSPCAKTSL